jgi:hypothetical protein
MAEATKDYTVEFSLTIRERKSEYDTRTPLRFEFKEQMPKNVDPQQYLRKRLSEELKRNFDALVEVLDNKTPEAVPGDELNPGY